MPRNAKISVYKEKEFETYVLWKSVPAYFRGMKKEQLLFHGFTDPLIIKTVMIKNQTQFAKIFHIKDLGTLTDWNNKIEKDSLYKNKFENIFSEQIVDVNNKITSQPNVLLENKIHEQRKLINLLKKENSLYKKQLKTRAQQKLKKIGDASPLIEPEVSPIVSKKESSFFQKIKRLFRNGVN
ncbi:hypothetical protein A3A20_00645 [Candidatus Wolfebacteria bacterium RIFCSPLOWO2_01_FULL_45_19]|uniref:Uncharacterized protein n=1 Tax=Candidatus Wolfebacteria bacterium RIFCSPLOWO2_01_FULL_45_19 TaxID=1802557 RepID=A0A1F8DRR7_9BACT|nr:MAG: hypothetical protein UX23_C0006G0004 [Parcubacteria group bacterium GW2011_GWB1_45_9]OGM91086.1 MAG: hypothetical protein A3A20_00645 [Candidatus Wolfebacteria bacterium RIFCSPLOWO2_01_FULL_45_19]